MTLISALARLSLQSTKLLGVRTVTRDTALCFRTTPCLLGEPLKKKKRLDPAIIKAREDRKKKKIEKQIRRLEKNARQLKPIEECEIPLVLLEQTKDRQRKAPKLSDEVAEQRVLLEKKWAQFKRDQHLADIKMLDRIVASQQKALDELRKESEELYQEAVQIDFRLVPFQCVGPVNAPPIANYNPPDGDYQDVSRKWN